MELKFLGGLTIQQDGEPLTELKSKKGRALLCYLALNQKQVTRPYLAALFWPDVPDSNAFSNLRKTLQRLKPMAPYLLIDRETIGINPDADFWLDVTEFEEGTNVHHGPADPHDIPRLQAAIALYQGDFLDGFMLPNAPLFEEWVLAQRARLREKALTALHHLVAHFREQQDYETTLSYARQRLTVEPWHEETHRALMELLALSGQRSEALVQYETCRRMLADELDVEPAAATAHLYEQIKAGAFDEVPEEQKPKEQTPIPDKLPPHNLPSQPTTFVGREVEIAAFSDLLDKPDVRLLTILGPGGIGKTRLALAIAEHQLDASQTKLAFPDGIFFVALAPLSTTDAIITAIAEAVGFQFGGEREPQEQLLGYLKKMSLLLILDNLEHLLAETIEGPTVAELVNGILDTALTCKILVTSRERVNLQRETIYQLGGLDLPDWETPEDALRYAAVQLFMQSAKQVRPDFELTTDNMDYVARICRLAQGMPLGIVLAAAWLEMLTPQEVAQEMQQSLDFLATELADWPERQRSIRAVFDNSWQRLTDAEQTVLAKLSVFRGGFTRQACQDVTGATLQTLLSLVNKSLLSRDMENGRYQIHELLRQYAAEKLGDGKVVQTQHLNFFVAFAENFDAGIFGPEPEAWVKRMLADIDNCRAALDWAARSGQAKAGLQLAAALSGYWISIGNWREGRRRLAQLLTLPAATEHTLARAQALYVVGHLACHMGDYEAGFDFLEESKKVGLALGDAGKVVVGWVMLSFGEHFDDNVAARQALEDGIAILRDAGEPWQLWLGLQLRAWSEIRSGNFAQAYAFFSECLAFTRKNGHKWLSGITRGSLGSLLYFQGDLGKAQVHIEESEIILRPLNDLRHRKLGTLGAIAMLQGNYQQAVAYFEERLRNFRKQGSEVYFAIAMCDLGIATGHLGNHTQAVALFLEALSLSLESSDLFNQAVCLLGVAGIQPQPRRAVQLLATAQAAFEASGAFRVEPFYTVESTRIERAARAVLGETAFAAAYAEGRAMTAEEAIGTALTESHEWDGTSTPLGWDGRETAESLLTELAELGWSQDVGTQEESVAVFEPSGDTSK